MHELEAILDSPEFDLNGWTRLDQFRYDYDSLVLDLTVATGRDNELPQHWRICCLNLGLFHLEPSPDYDVALVPNHVLLWKCTLPTSSLFINGKTDNHLCLVGALYAKHREVVGEFYNFGETFNETELVLSKGYGLLATGPRPLLQAYAEVLEEYGVRASIPEQSRRLNPDASEIRSGDWPGVLFIGDTYVVARQYEFERVTTSMA